MQTEQTYKNQQSNLKNISELTQYLEIQYMNKTTLKNKFLLINASITVNTYEFKFSNSRYID